LKAILRQAWPLVVAQAVCLTVGLWMQHNQMVSMIRMALEDEARRDMGQALAALGDPPQHALDDEAVCRLRAAFAHYAADGAVAFAIDRKRQDAGAPLGRLRPPAGRARLAPRRHRW
jgi:hypothetical protein